MKLMLWVIGIISLIMAGLRVMSACAPSSETAQRQLAVAPESQLKDAFALASLVIFLAGIASLLAMITFIVAISRYSVNKVRLIAATIIMAVASVSLFIGVGVSVKMTKETVVTSGIDSASNLSLLIGIAAYLFIAWAAISTALAPHRYYMQR